jgi:hypothetical protein
MFVYWLIKRREPMLRIIGILISVFGGLMVLLTVIDACLGKYNAPVEGGLQKFVGGAGGGIIILALGLALAKRKQSDNW